MKNNNINITINLKYYRILIYGCFFEEISSLFKPPPKKKKKKKN